MNIMITAAKAPLGDPAGTQGLSLGYRFNPRKVSRGGLLLDKRILRKNVEIFWKKMVVSVLCCPHAIAENIHDHAYTYKPGQLVFLPLIPH